jgi:hypothetical protein
MKTTDNHETTQLDEIFFMEDMTLIRGVTLYKGAPLKGESLIRGMALYKGGSLRGKSLNREAAIENGKIFLKGTTDINQDQSEEGATLIRLPDFNKVYPRDVVDLVRCLR